MALLRSPTRSAAAPDTIGVLKDVPVAAGRAMWPWGASSAVPASCGAGDVDWTEAP